MHILDDGARGRWKTTEARVRERVMEDGAVASIIRAGL